MFWHVDLFLGTTHAMKSVYLDKCLDNSMRLRYTCFGTWTSFLLENGNVGLPKLVLHCSSVEKAHINMFYLSLSHIENI